jgi:hypothetical protein
LGESFTHRATASLAARADDGLGLVRVTADRDAAGLDVRAGHVELERRDAGLGVETAAGQLVVDVLEPADRDDERSPECAHGWQHRVGEGLQPGIGQADRVEHAGLDLAHARGLVALAREWRHGLGDDERELAVDREPGRAGGQRVERAGRIHHGMLELERADAGREVGAHAAATRSPDTTGPSTQSRTSSPPRRTAQP